MERIKTFETISKIETGKLLWLSNTAPASRLGLERVVACVKAGAVRVAILHRAVHLRAREQVQKTRRCA